jgi:heat shock protein HtpX
MASYGLIPISSRTSGADRALIGLLLPGLSPGLCRRAAGEALTYDAPVNVLIRRALIDALYAAPWATLGTALWIFIAYKFHQSMIDAVTGGREVTRQEQQRLYNLLENLCISRGITMPKLKVIEDDSHNAFATGMNDKQYSITVMSGLINSLDDAEIEAVLGHELTHIRNGDVRMLVIAVIIAGAIAFCRARVPADVPGWIQLAWQPQQQRSQGRGIAILIAIALIAVAWVLSIVIRFALSRKREYLADAGSVELTKNPDAMISALRRSKAAASLRRDLGGDGNASIIRARVFQCLRHPSADRRAGGGAGEICGGHDPGPLALPERPAPTGSDQDNMDQLALRTKVLRSRRLKVPERAQRHPATRSPIGLGGTSSADNDPVALPALGTAPEIAR